MLGYVTEITSFSSQKCLTSGEQYFFHLCFCLQIAITARKFAGFTHRQSYCSMYGTLDTESNFTCSA
jgi:hypothetical protein